FAEIDGKRVAHRTAHNSHPLKLFETGSDVVTFVGELENLDARDRRPSEVHRAARNQLDDVDVRFVRAAVGDDVARLDTGTDDFAVVVFDRRGDLVDVGAVLAI